MWQTLADKFKALIFILPIVTLSIALAWFLSGWQSASLIAVVQLAIIWIAKPIWMSDKSNFLLRGIVLTIVSGVVLLGNSWWQPLVSNLVHQYFPNIPLPDYSVSPITLLFLLILVTIVFRYTRPEPVIEKPEKKIADLIEGPTIKQKWESICESLSSSIRDIDRATNWSHEYYTPLDAEVEMKTSTRTNKVVKDLLEAIKESDDRLFLLVGEPGAGKSVALRKLCLDILKDSVKHEYIPIYVNLKEWTNTEKDWSRNPPTSQDLRNFVKQKLSKINPRLTDFFEKHYDVLDENGNLFFVLDSFDEIPQVLGTTEDAKLIEDLTIVCREFLKGSKQKRSKGILASREYRMPKEDFLEANTKLIVRPLTVEKIEQSLTQSKETVEKLMRERPGLVPSLRNPFILSLLKVYLIGNNNQFPKTQAELFEFYINNAITKSCKTLEKTDIELNTILSITTTIAKIIFSDWGLQAPLSILKREIKHSSFDDIIAILRHTHIVRGDNSEEFSFAHRRFYEYFVVQDLLNAGKTDLPLENIPTDSRWRDTLVLYCEVAPFEEARRIANYCWFDVIAKNNNIRDYASRHCLRFLTEGFRGRKECLVDFEYDLAVYLINTIRNYKDMPDVKFASECIGILKEEYLDIAASDALSYNNRWINETSLRGCRHLNSISENLENKLVEVLDPKKKSDFWGIDPSILLRQRNVAMSERELLLSLTLSEAFVNIKKRVEWMILNKKIESYGNYLFLTLFIVLAIYPIPFFSYLKPTQEGEISVEFINCFLNFGLLIFTILGMLVPISKEIGLKLFYKNTNFYKTKTILKKNPIGNFKKYLIFLSISSVFILINTIFKDGVMLFLLFLLGLKVLVVIAGLILLLLELIKYIKIKIFFNNIDKDKCNQREYIYTTFWILTQSMIFPDKFLSYLETNVKEVHGKYPSENFLEVSSGEWFIRLAKLEERWREAEERAVEQQNTPKPQSSFKVEKTIKDLVRENQLEEAITVFLKKEDLSKDDKNNLILLQSRLAMLEKRKDEGRIETEAYHVGLTELKKSLLNMSDELEI